MESKSLEDRVTLLENEMQALRRLPDRVASLDEQFVQFRVEVRGEFSASRSELGGEIKALGEVLRKEMRAGADETRRLMRVLHEDLIARIAALNRG